MDFSDALKALKSGSRVCRNGWNGRNMWQIYVPGTPQVTTREGTPYHKAGLTLTDINPHIDMFTADGKMQPGWLASQTDMLADDWMTIPPIAGAKVEPETDTGDYQPGDPDAKNTDPKAALAA